MADWIARLSLTPFHASIFLQLSGHSALALRTFLPGGTVAAFFRFELFMGTWSDCVGVRKKPDTPSPEIV